MSKVLLLGKSGMLGRAIRQNYELRITNYECISWSKDDLDITNKHAVFAKITQLKPTVVINANGYTNVDGAETERETAFAAISCKELRRIERWLNNRPGKCLNFNTPAEALRRERCT